jgi:hypothetical protein
MSGRKETKKEDDEEIELYLNSKLSADYENLRKNAIAINDDDLWD